MTFRLAVVTAGLSQPSSTRLLADRIAAAASAALGGVGHEVELEAIELRPLAHAITDAMLTGFPAGDLAAALESVARADALVAVTPVFGGTFSGLFKSFVDVIPRGDLAGTPVVLAATGGSTRHSLAVEHALRPLLAFHQAITVPTGVFAATDDFGGAGADGLTARIERAAQELARLVGPASASDDGSRDDAREESTGQTSGWPQAPSIARTREEDTMSGFTPFAELLAARGA